MRLCKARHNRKNSLFVGSLEAGERYANLLTVLLNCELAGVNPYVYLVGVIDKIAADWAADRVAELLPAPGSLLARPNRSPQARLPSSPLRSSSCIAWVLSHPARHPSQMVTVGRIRGNLGRPVLSDNCISPR